MLMPRFHFEIVDGVRIADPVGTICKSEEQARQLAANIARQIAIDVARAQTARLWSSTRTVLKYTKRWSRNAIRLF